MKAIPVCKKNDVNVYSILGSQGEGQTVNDLDITRKSNKGNCYTYLFHFTTYILVSYLMFFIITYNEIYFASKTAFYSWDLPLLSRHLGSVLTRSDWLIGCPFLDKGQLLGDLCGGPTGVLGEWPEQVDLVAHRAGQHALRVDLLVTDLGALHDW